MLGLNLVGQVYTRLTVVSLSDKPASKSEGKIYVCQCQCGEVLEVFTRRLRSGNTKSCGCLNRELTAARNTKHGKRYHPLYDAWKSMVARCTNIKDSNYEFYGGRGITVYPNWLGENGLDNFITDMPERPEGTSLDRINNDLGYFPDNVRWTTKEMQSFNRRGWSKDPNNRTGVSKVTKNGVWKGRWQATIQFEGKRKQLGVFDTQQDAIDAREAAEMEIYGQLKP